MLFDNYLILKSCLHYILKGNLIVKYKNFCFHKEVCKNFYFYDIIL